MTEAHKSIRVEVVYALPEACWSRSLELAEGATVASALAVIGTEALAALAGVDPGRIAIFSRPVRAESVLRDGDRIELLRPLVADPKQSRRARASTRPGARS